MSSVSQSDAPKNKRKAAVNCNDESEARKKANISQLTPSEVLARTIHLKEEMDVVHVKTLQIQEINVAATERIKIDMELLSVKRKEVEEMIKMALDRKELNARSLAELTKFSKEQGLMIVEIAKSRQQLTIDQLKHLDMLHAFTVMQADAIEKIKSVTELMKK